VNGIGDDAVSLGKGDPILAHKRMHDRERDHAGKTLQLTKDQGAMRPGAEKSGIEVIASGFGRKAAVAGGARRAVRRDPIAKPRCVAPEPSAGLGGLVPSVVPDAVDQKSHDALTRFEPEFFLR
jgi:hypothetical protein